MADMKFEDAFKKLEKIVDDLEAGNTSLDDSLVKYEEGVRLARACQKSLEMGRKKIEMLVKSKDGKFKLEPFEDLPEASGKKKPKQERPSEDTLF